MDYIIFGVGAGSSLVLIGWLLRDWGPALRDRKSRSDTEQVLTAQQLVDQMQWARFCGSCGAALTISGAFVLLFTAIALAVNPTDERGAMIVLTTFGIVSIAMLVWSWLFVRRFGVAGIIRTKPESAIANAATEEEGRLDEKHDDLGFRPVGAIAETSEPQLTPRRGLRSMVPKNPFASRRTPDVPEASPVMTERLREQGQTPRQEPEPAVSAGDDQAVGQEPEPAVSVEDDEANAQQTATGEETATTDDTMTGTEVGTTDEEAPAMAPEPAADVVSPDVDPATAEPAIESDQGADGSVDVIGGDQEPVDAVADTQAGDQADAIPDTKQVAAGEEPGGEATETVSSREEALRNLRRRRLGRLTHGPS